MPPELLEPLLDVLPELLELLELLVLLELLDPLEEPELLEPLIPELLDAVLSDWPVTAFDVAPLVEPPPQPLKAARALTPSTNPRNADDRFGTLGSSARSR